MSFVPEAWAVSGNFYFFRESGSWRLRWAYPLSADHFLPQERAIDAFLPKEYARSDPDLVTVIVEIGADGMNDRQTVRLEEYLKRLAKETSGDLDVLFEISAGLPFAQVIAARDASLEAKIWGCSFADTTNNGRPPPGVRVNKVDLEDLDELPPLPEDHPALGRIIMLR